MMRVSVNRIFRSNLADRKCPSTKNDLIVNGERGSGWKRVLHIKEQYAEIIPLFSKRSKRVLSRGFKANVIQCYIVSERRLPSRVNTSDFLKRRSMRKKASQYRANRQTAPLRLIRRRTSGRLKKGSLSPAVKA